MMPQRPIRNEVTVGLRRVEEAIAGDNVIIGAKAVVLQDVFPNSIAVGARATVSSRPPATPETEQR
ncbi:hypothetical protein [Bradyrhizobium japonicum]|uniref:hypothetical protein n=1 Tax=Bradyrhizobium japonicum TaxID=375 RepID=UPI000462D3F6|nr:hypothetical protein [Bradyrhizobium japonicum]